METAKPRQFSLAFPMLLLLMMSLSMCEPTNITTDQIALLALKSHITSDPYKTIATNWSALTFPCTWVGVSCGSRHRRVTQLHLSGMSLTAEIPPQLGRLSFLVSLDLRHNNFHGSLPPNLANMRRLRFLDFSVNNFSGNLPAWLGLLPKLEHLNLQNNSFSGPLPSFLSNITTLEQIHLSYNSLQGEIPQEIGHLPRLMVLDIQYNHLTGSIPFTIFNISTIQVVALTKNELSGSLPLHMCDNIPQLQGLYLSYNNLEGEIPASLSKCFALQILSLSYNRFRGQIPPQIGNLTDLLVLYLGGNLLTGEFPQEIGNLNSMEALALESNQIMGSIPTGIFNNMSFLVFLDLYGNSLSGTLPANICHNFSGLELLNLDTNHFYGKIPRMLHMCTNLQELDLGSNSFTGTIPYEIFNISALTRLDLTLNYRLSGTLPPSMGSNLPNLKKLYLGEMNMDGVIPESISNSSKLIHIELSYNNFSGPIPRSLGNLRYLQLLSMQNNTLHYEPSLEEPSIIDFLTKFRYLTELRISFNPLGGALSTSVGNLSSALEIFVASGCGLKGNIPTQIGNLRNLIELNLSGNDLSGFIPTTLDRLQHLQKLELANNKLRGSLTTSLCRLRNLGLLALSFNQMSDGIPECFSNLSFLRELYIDHNRFSFGIPPSFWDLKGLLTVDMSANFLNESLSVNVVKLEDVIHLDLSNNQFSGNIPTSITEMQNLEILHLANNKLQGPIPEFKDSTIALEFLDISHNTLTGVIPKSLENLKNLKYLNLSFNNLSGEIPSGGCFQNLTRQSFMFNEALCGSPRFGVPTCPSPHPHSRKKKVLIIVFVLLGGLMSLLIFTIIAFLLVRRYKKKNISPSGTNQLSIWEPQRISYYELVQATAGFSQSNLLGFGSFGSVYKGILHSGLLVAIKVFNQSQHAQRSLEVECEVLKNLRHRNLTKIITGCFGDNFKALVIEYMPNGNLEQWLYSETNFLDILLRLNIMIDVASALEYLHYGYFTPVIHCDLKPSNVLLDEEMVAHVSDFSITKLLAGKDETFVHTKTLATLGYMAPEYGMHGRVSTSCDVYSFGIMMMEIFSRKKPIDEMFTEDMSLTSWVRDALPYHPFQVIDASLFSGNNDDKHLNVKLQCASSLMELALHCAGESPEERPTMKEVVATLNKIKLSFLQAS